MITKLDFSNIKDKGILDGRDISLFLIENKKTKNNPVTVFSLSMNKDVAKEVRSIAKEYVKEILSTVEEIKKEQVPGEMEVPIPEYNPDHAQVLFQLNKNKMDALYLDGMAPFLSGTKNAMPFERKKVLDKNLKAWVLRFGYGPAGKREYIYFFQKFQASQLLKNKLNFWEVGGEFVLLKGSIFTIKNEMDFLLYKDTFVVTKMVAFEKLFGYEAFYKKEATELVTTLKEDQYPGLDYQVEFPDFPKVKSKIQQSTRIAHRLHAAKRNAYFKKISFIRLRELNRRHNLDLTLDKVNKKWNVDETSNLMIVAQVLNDDYGISQLTDNEYLAQAKRRLKIPEVKPSKKKAAVKGVSTTEDETVVDAVEKVPV